ncbi:MAG: cytochrome c biogenesis protein CcdA [bacterium]|nr:cytochrome c biogenesis protein CcdA [bacterium]
MILNYIANGGNEWFLPIIAGAAVADSINPCAFSILFLSVLFLFSLGKNRTFILTAGGAYILGIALVYTAIGVGILGVLSIFAVPNFMGKVGAVILIVYSLIAILNEFFPAFPLKLKIPEASHQIIGKIIHRASIPAALILGIVVGMFEFPCTGGPYLFVLSLIHDQKTFWSGFGYLVIYNIIFVLPLIIMLALTASKTVLEKIDRLRKLETKSARIILNFVLLVIGALIFFT